MALTKDVFGDVSDNLLEMNASDEKDWINDQVKQFARTQPYGEAKFKIIFSMSPMRSPTMLKERTSDYGTIR